MYFMSDPQALHITRNVIPGKLGVDLHLHRVHIPLVTLAFSPRDLYYRGYQKNNINNNNNICKVQNVNIKSWLWGTGTGTRWL